MSKWFSIKDAVPPNENDVIAIKKMYGEDYPPDIVIASRKVYKNGRVKWHQQETYGSRIIFIENEVNFMEITHWMPLPEMPNEI